MLQPHVKRLGFQGILRRLGLFQEIPEPALVMPELGRDTPELVIAMPEESAGSDSGYAEYESKQIIVQPFPLKRARAGPLLCKLL